MQSLRVNVKQVLILESQFYVLLVNFRNSLYALRCVHNVFFFYTVVCFCNRRHFLFVVYDSGHVTDTAGH